MKNVLYGLTFLFIAFAVRAQKGDTAIDCWVLEHGDENGTEKFWISKKTREVLKEEDHGKSGGYRFKYKLGISAV